MRKFLIAFFIFGYIFNAYCQKTNIYIFKLINSMIYSSSFRSKYRISRKSSSAWLSASHG